MAKTSAVFNKINSLGERYYKASINKATCQTIEVFLENTHTQSDSNPIQKDHK